MPLCCKPLWDFRALLNEMTPLLTGPCKRARTLAAWIFMLMSIENPAEILTRDPISSCFGRLLTRSTFLAKSGRCHGVPFVSLTKSQTPAEPSRGIAKSFKITKTADPPEKGGAIKALQICIGLSFWLLGSPWWCPSKRYLKICTRGFILSSFRSQPTGCTFLNKSGWCNGVLLPTWLNLNSILDRADG